MNPIVPPAGPRPLPGPRPVPEDVRTAAQLWWAALLLGVVQLTATLISQLGQRRELAAKMLDQLREQQPAITEAQVQMWTVVLLVVMAFFWLILTGAAAALVYLMRHGKNWARAILTALAVFLTLGALGTLFAPGSGMPGVIGAVAGGAGIVQSVAACGAVFLCYRKESEQYFRPVAH
ncbi:hypothetical protein [Nocardia yamanashiensis]|uniref:hypothetical protein n=1 Tax=Nocardia yamanashiensis TaxID=209247 RepID=UPI000B03B1C3|nr:hypothetical protein [Nocardia yamanashiensis]